MRSKFIFINFVVLLVVFAGIDFYLYKNFSENNTKLFKEWFLYKLEKYRIKSEEAMKHNDDLTLLSIVEDIHGIKNIEYSFILNKKYLVVAHSKVKELGKTYNSQFDKNTLKLKNTEFYLKNLNNNKIYELVIPLWKGSVKMGVLRTGINANSLFKKNKEIFQILIIYSLIIVIFILIIQGIIINSQFYPTLKEISLSIEKLNMEQYDENLLFKHKEKIIKNIEKNLNQLKEKLKNIKPEEKEKFSADKKLLKSLTYFTDKGFIYVNLDNTVEFINKKAKELLNLNKEIQNQHIFDCFDNEILSLIEEAAKKQEEIVTEDIKNKKISAIFLDKIGILISIE